VPSDTIRSQTLSRLQDRADPYRQSLDTNLGNVAVLDIDGAIRMKRALLDMKAGVTNVTVSWTVFHDHKGFNWRVLRALVAARFELVRTLTSPFSWTGPQLGTQVWFVARRR
jgi:hypothetical protein